MMVVFFFKQKTAYEMRISDWSSDVCSSDLKVEGNDADSDSGMTAVTGATATVTCAVNDDVNNTLLAVEVRNPGYQYLQGVITSATANIAFGEMTVMLKPRNVPVTQGDTVSDSVTVSD